MKTTTKTIFLLIFSLFMSFSAYSIPELVPSEYCDAETFHLGIEAETNSKILLTITNKDANTITFRGTTPEGSDLIDVFFVEGQVPVENTEGAESLEMDVYYANPTENVTVTILWSKVGNGGNWMVQNITVPFLGSCDVEPTDLVAPEMTAATFDSATGYTMVLNVAATDDVTNPVTNFIVNGGPFTNKAVIATDGKITLTGLAPSTEYTFNVKAKDAALNVSATGIDVVASTSVLTSQCNGSLGHFGTPDIKRVNYDILYSSGTVTYVITPFDDARSITSAEIQTSVNGTFTGGQAMTVAADGKSASYSRSYTDGDAITLLFLYGLDDIPGMEMTAENTTNPSAIYYEVGDCFETGNKKILSQNNIWPNPATDFVNIISNQNITKVEVINQNGEIATVISANSNQVSLKVSNLAKGVYFVKIYKNEDVSTESLIVK